MADPITIVGAIAAVTQLAALTKKIATRVCGLRAAYQNTPDALQQIETECSTLKASLEHIDLWIKGTLAHSPDGHKTTEHLQQALSQFICPLNALSTTLKRMAKPGGGTLTKINYLLDESALKDKLVDIQWQSAALTMLVSCSKL